uniref:cGMP-dependent protein kinase n=1 Tax=Pyrodinium bahamense TaxID=73915 RepID=A0A7S0AEF2_9DINO
MSHHLEPAALWCEQMGAVDVEEVEDTWEELAEHLGLEGAERQRLAEACAPALAAEVLPPPRGLGCTGEGPETFGSAKDPYIVVGRLGKGATATVYKCRRGEVHFAAKVLQLEHFRMHSRPEQLLEATRREVSLLWALRHERIVQLHDVVETATRLVLVMELMDGTLFDLIVSRGRLPTNEARHIFVQVVEGLKYIHSRSVVHRDLKPENILINADGYVKLTDFGFAKLIDHRTYTLCGTPEYIAPEVLLNKGHGKPVDWWTLGILIYEMIVGYPPFVDEDPMGIYQKILSGKIVFPKLFDKNAKALVKKLLTADLGKRFGNLKNGVDDIKQHKWFKDIVWEHLLEKRIAAPFKPEVKSASDTSNFDDYPDSDELPPIVAAAQDPFSKW